MRWVLLVLAASGAARAEPVDDARAALEKTLPWIAEDGARTDLGKLGKELDNARKRAVGFIFDNQRYPVPAQVRRGWRVGVDVQPGHRDMERRVAAAIILHNRLIGQVVERLRVKTRTVGLEEPTRAQPEIVRPVQFYGIVVIDAGLSKFLKKYKPRYEAWARLAGKPQRKDALVHAVGALAKKDWKGAARWATSLWGADRVVWDVLRAASVLAWNERHGAGHDFEEREGLRVVNALRVSLGLPPFIHDKRLHFMAADFAHEMKRLRFFSHHHPRDPARRTSAHRARRAGYRWGTGENVSTERDAAKAMWKWRADAGHHRLLMRSVFRAAGMGCESTSVLNLGTATTAPILPLYGAGR